MNPNLLWLIPGLPLLSLLVIVFGLIVGPARSAANRVSGYIAILGIFGSWLLALWSLGISIGGTTLSAEIPWFQVGANAEFALGVKLDALAAMMLVVVTTVSLLVQVYSQGYMAGDPGYRRYFAFISLFTVSMLGLVLADNLLQVYMFWELVGLCSYLLIGFWYQKPEAAAAAKKAFIVTRFGDFGFLIGLLILYTTTGTFKIEGLFDAATAGTLAGTTLTIAMIGVFCGAVGKSAQFPLHVWLPDAMEGPTPVSALIHAATMVAAGVYLVARMFELFAHSPTAMLVVAAVGGFTAIFAATQGLVMRDIKRVLAYSTVSQLGYMMLGLGVGAYVGGVFHLFNHAFFKALLFLAAGSLIHGSGEQDLFRLGGLRKQMPWTALTFLIGGLALAGIFPLAGFWSKDEILAAAYRSPYPVLFWFALITAFLTAFYISRAWILAFWGERREPAHAEQGDEQLVAHGGQGHGAAHESPVVMILPLVLLAIPSILSGLLNSPWANGAFGHFLAPQEQAEPMDMMIAVVSSALALAGIGLAWLMYGAKVISAASLTNTFRPVHRLLENRYYMDRLYEDVVVRGAVLGISNAIALFDRRVVDGAVNGVGWLMRNVLGYAVDRTESGQEPNYALSIFAGVVVIAVAVVASQLGR